MPGVHITIRNVETGITRTVQTNHSGSFTLTSLGPGKYELKAEMDGFRSYQKTGSVLEIGQTMRDDITLSVGAVTESVSVTADIAALNTENGAIKGDVIVQQEIMDLLLDGRDFTDLAFLVPGVMPNAQGGQGSFASINGARGTDTNFYVDGFSNRNSRGAAAQVRPNMSSMQEFKMEVSGYDASIGRMAGGVLNMVMKSGTNEFHGDIFEYVRNNVIDARGFFDVEKQRLNRHSYGATLAGPVWLPKLYNGHNKTFFMFSIPVRQTELPIVNHTGLEGCFNFKLHWTPESTRPVVGGAMEGGFTFHRATQEQLGLRLRSQKALVEILVIDHVEKPSEN